jgi:hypothetical protein
MTDDIAIFHGKMMIGHGGLLSGMSVGSASLYQKIPPACSRQVMSSIYLRWCTLK